MPSVPAKHACLICFAFLMISCLNDLNAQEMFNPDSIVVDSASQFLWFHGHWNPADKKQFIIDKNSAEAGGGSPGGTVTVNNDGSAKLETGGIDDWNKKIDEDLNIIDDWANKLNNPSSADLASYDLNKILLADVKEDKEEYNNYKIDSKADIITPGKEKQGMNDLANRVSANCREFRSKYDAIMDFWKAHKKDNDADLSIPPPPEFEYNCYACDSNLRKVYDSTIAHYTRDFFHPEDSLVRQGLEVIRSFALMGIGPAAAGGVPDDFNPILDLFHPDKKDASKSGPCAYLDLYRLSDAIRDIAYHSYRRACELIRRYSKDFRATEAIGKTALEGIRNWILFSGEDNASQDALNRLAQLVQLNIDFYINKLNQHDWKQLANIPFIYSLIRQKALLGGDEDPDTKDLAQEIGEIFNRFYLNIDMDIKVGTGGGYELCHLKGKVKVAPDFVATENQCFRWVVIEDQPKLLPFSLGGKTFTVKEQVKKMSQQIDVDLLANEIIAPSPLKPVYAGTRKYHTTLKNLSTDFCNPEKDSILLTSFIPSPKATSGLWNIPHSPPQPLGINGLDHFFQDVNKMQEEAQSGQAEAEAGDMKMKAEELRTKMEALKSQMGNGKNKDNLEKYIELQKIASQGQDLGSNNKVSPILSIGFQLPVENGDVMVNKKFDAKEINPRNAEAIVYGYYTIRIEYKKTENSAQ